MKFLGTTAIAVVFTTLFCSAFAHAQAPTLTQVYGPATVPPGCRNHYCPARFGYLPPFLIPPVAYAPPLAYAPPVVEAPPPSPPPVVEAPPALPPMGWIYGPFTSCGDPQCGVLIITVGADGLNVRTTPNGFITASLANGVPVIPLQHDGPWVLVAPACPLAPTYTFSVTGGGVPLSVCL